MPDVHFTEDDRRLSELLSLFDDVIRFGCAIGSWTKSDQYWHRQGAMDSIKAMAKRAAEELIMIDYRSKQRASDDAVVFVEPGDVSKAQQEVSNGQSQLDSGELSHWKKEELENRLIFLRGWIQGKGGVYDLQQK